MDFRPLSGACDAGVSRIGLARELTDGRVAALPVGLRAAHSRPEAATQDAVRAVVIHHPVGSRPAPYANLGFALCCDGWAEQDSPFRLGAL